MTTKCIAIVENPMQRENLCQCCKIIGVKPKVKVDTVYAETTDKEKSDKLIALFEQYVRHRIMVSDGDDFRLNCKY